MDKSKIGKKVHREVLAEMRAEYAEEIRNCIKVLVDIRDNGKTDKDRIDASYKLSRLLGMGISSEVTKAAHPNQSQSINKSIKLSKSDLDKIDKLIGLD